MNYNKGESNDDFEIIESPDCANDINNNKESYNKFHKFIGLIFKIIFDSRNQSSQFKSKNKKNDKKENSFKIDFEELIEYENLGKQKYFIDFYLIKNDKQNYYNKTKLNDKNKLLIERWKIKYKDENRNRNNIKNFDLYLNKKMKIIEKSVVTYSRILPLFNISKQENISTIFEFTPKIKKKLGTKTTAEKIKLINDNMFSFKLSIKYLKPEAIYKFINANSSENSDNVRRSSFNKVSPSNFLLNNQDKINNSPNNDARNLDYRRLSYDYYSSKMEEINSDSDCENYDNYDLVIKESDSGHNVKNSENNNLKENIENKNKKNKNNNNKKFGKEKHKDNLQNIEIKNNAIKSIVQDYKHLRDMVQTIPNYGNINNKKLATFISNN